MGQPMEDRPHWLAPQLPEVGRPAQHVPAADHVAAAAHAEPARLLRPAQPLTQDQLAVLARAVRAAPLLLDGAPCRLRAAANRVELHAASAASGCAAGGAAAAGSAPGAAGRAGRAGRVRTVACGMALRNLELGVRHLGLVPQIIELPDRAVPAHLATVLVGAAAACTVLEERLYRSVFRRLQHRGPLAPRPVPPALAMQLHAAGQAPGVATMLVGGAQLRSVSEALAAGAGAGRLDELARGRLLLATTAEDGPVDWLRAGQALQNVWLTAATFGLVGAALGIVLEAPGVRSGLVERLGLTGVPQVMLRLGWPAAGQARPARQEGSARCPENAATPATPA